MAQLRVQLGLVFLASLGAAACGDATATPRAACAGGVAVQDGAMCLFTGAITGSEHQCPPELPYEYSGDGWWLCSDRADLDATVIDAAVREAGVPDDTGDQDATDDTTSGDGTCRTDAECAVGQVCMDGRCFVNDPGDDADTGDHGDADTGPGDDGSTDDAIDQGTPCRTDLECAVGTVCVRNTCVADGSGPDDPEDGRTDDGGFCNDNSECASGQLCLANTCVADQTTTPDDQVGHIASFSGNCASDYDLDGSCTGLDMDDADPNVRDIGIWQTSDGRYEIVGCVSDETAWTAYEQGGSSTSGLDENSCAGINICLADPADLASLGLPEGLLTLQAELCAGWTGGYIKSESNYGGMETVCTTAGFCWTSFLPCLDAAGNVTECAGSTEECRDDNRDGICD